MKVRVLKEMPFAKVGESNHDKYYNRDKAREYRRTYLKKNPWAKHLVAIRNRCTNPKIKTYKNYGGKGIKCLLTIKDIKWLWYEDEADLMKRPSIDRFDNKEDYILENCQFIELKDNVIKGNHKPCKPETRKKISQSLKTYYRGKNEKH